MNLGNKDTLRTMAPRKKKLYEGKAKILFEGPEPGTVIQHFKDDATALNGKKHAIIAGKGVLNNRISAHLMTRLEGAGIPTHFLRSINAREQLVRAVDIIPIELVVRNVVAGSLAKRFNIKEGAVLGRPLIEFYYKNDELNDPMVSEDHIITFGWADTYELEEMVAMAWRVNDYLNGLFAGLGVILVDFKLEFGRLWGEHGELYLILADEISPDNCRLWDEKTKEKMDKDRFRLDLEDQVKGYHYIAERLGLVPQDIMSGGSLDENMADKLSLIENEFSQQRRLRELNPGKPRKA